MTTSISRRRFAAGLGGAMVTRPMAAWAQQQTTVGFLSGASQQGIAHHRIAAFQQGLATYDYFEGHNVAIEYRWAGGKLEQLPAMAADLVKRGVAVIVSQSDLATIAAKKATASIPIVFITGGDAVRTGFVASLNRPGGNLTGTTFLNADLGPKRLGLLHEIVPKADPIALLLDDNFEDAVSQLAGIEEAAHTLGRRTIIFHARTVANIDSAFAAFKQQHVGGLVLVGGNFFTNRGGQIIGLAARYGIPTIYLNKDYAAAGGLMSYGNDPTDTFRQAGLYAGRILKGERPADLPVVQPTKWELVINLNTSRALGLTFPPGMLAIADEVIE